MVAVTQANTDLTINKSIEQQNINENAVGILAGKKVYVNVKYNVKAMVISLIASAIIIALGITLISVFATPAAIAAGVSLIAVGLGFFLFHSTYLYGKKVRAEETAVNRTLEKNLQTSNFQDLPKIQCEETQKTIKVQITKEQIESAEPNAEKSIGFQPATEENKAFRIPFLLTISKINNQKYLNAWLMDAVFKPIFSKKILSFEIDGREQVLKDHPINVK